MITILAGIVQRGNPDRKHAIPVYQYVKRHHVSKGRFLRSVNSDGSGTLTLIQVVIPRVYRYAYSAALVKRFQLWIKSYPSAELVEVDSIADMVRCGLTGGNNWPYVVSICDFAHSELEVDADYTFGAQIVRRQLPLPVMWGYVNDKYTDSITLAEMTDYRDRNAQQLHRERAHYRRSIVRGQLEIPDINRRARTLSDIVSGPLHMASDGPTIRRNPAIGVSRTPVTANPRQRSISAHDKGPSGSSTRMCFCCCEEKPMHVLNCGHVCCETCIDTNVRFTQQRLCYMCKTEWTFHRPVDSSSVLPHVVCDVCEKPRVYAMICGHATCGCPDSVCSRCNTGATVQVFM